MRNFGTKRFAVIAAMAGVVAIAAPTLASAAPSTQAPEMTVEQGDFAGKNVQVTTTNPNGPVSACVPLLVSGDTALKALAAYSAGDTNALVGALSAPDSVRVGEFAVDAGPSVTSWQVEDGVHLLVGACKTLDASDTSDGAEIDYTTLLGDAAITMEPLILPSGIGSLSPVLAFGSAAIMVPGALDAIMELLSGVK